MQVSKLETNKLSYYRTLHCIEHYAEITDIQELREYCQWAKENSTKVYILGNGSNTLFSKRNIKTLVLKNKISEYIKPLSEEKYEISSSVHVIEVLKLCYRNKLDSFYYLASVPASIGGALAMNAGRGREHNKSIYDFVESVTFFENGEIKTIKSDQIKKSYRTTIFTGLHSKFILNAVFHFPKTNFEANPIIERNKWSKKYQDHEAPNCGSVFKLACPSLLRKLMGIRLFDAYYSSKTYNWILNRSRNSTSIFLLIKLAILLHRLRGKPIGLEIITID